MSVGDLSIIAAKQEITEVIYKYCRAMDRIDRDLGFSLWQPDATVDYGERFRGGTAIEFVSWVCDLHAGMVRTSHQISNILIDVDGDQATAESYVLAVLRFSPNGTLIDRVVIGRYLDRFVRVEGRWLIGHRRYEHDISHDLPVPPQD